MFLIRNRANPCKESMHGSSSSYRHMKWVNPPKKFAYFMFVSSRYSMHSINFAWKVHSRCTISIYFFINLADAYSRICFALRFNHKNYLRVIHSLAVMRAELYSSAACRVWNSSGDGNAVSDDGSSLLWPGVRLPSLGRICRTWLDTAKCAFGECISPEVLHLNASIDE